MSSRIKNPPRSRERFIPLPIPNSPTARPRGSGEAFRRRLDPAAFDPRFKPTQPPDWWWWNQGYDVDARPTAQQKARKLIPVAPLDARARRHLRRRG